MSDVYHRFFLHKAFGSLDICHTIYQVVRRTPRGAWIREHIADQKRWVGDGNRKAFAYRDPVKAWNSFCIRMRHRKIYAIAEMDAVNRTLEALEQNSDLMERAMSSRRHIVRIFEAGNDYPAYEEFEVPGLLPPARSGEGGRSQPVPEP